MLNVVVVVDKDNTHFNYRFDDVNEPINSRYAGTDDILVVSKGKKTIAVFKEWSLWKQVE